MPTFALLFTSFALLVGAAACGSDSGGTTQPGSTGAGGEIAGGTLTLYSGRSESLIKPLVERFTDETGIKVELKAGDSADLAQLIDTEGDASPADVFLSQTAGATGYLLGKDRLQALPAEVTELVPDEARDPQGRWVGVTGRVRVLVHNTRVDKASLPAKVTDLTAPQYRDRIGVAPTNASFQDFVAAMKAEAGEDATKTFLSGLAANGAKTFANNGAIVTAVGQGEIDFGLVNHYYLVKAKKENPALAAENHFFPDGDLGSMLNVSSVGVLETARNKPQAERFVRFLLSAPAQEHFATKEAEYPLVAGVALPPGLPALDTLKLEGVDIAKLGGDLQDTIALIQASGLTR